MPAAIMPMTVSKAIERILKAKARPRTLEAVRNEQAAEQLRKALPRIKQRSLHDYSALLGGSRHENQTEDSTG